MEPLTLNEMMHCLAQRYVTWEHVDKALKSVPATCKQDDPALKFVLNDQEVDAVITLVPPDLQAVAYSLITDNRHEGLHPTETMRTWYVPQFVGRCKFDPVTSLVDLYGDHKLPTEIALIHHEFLHGPFERFQIEFLEAYGPRGIALVGETRTGIRLGPGVFNLRGFYEPQTDGRLRPVSLEEISKTYHDKFLLIADEPVFKSHTHLIENEPLIEYLIGIEAAHKRLCERVGDWAKREPITCPFDRDGAF